MFNWPAVAKFEDRLYQVFGDRPDLVPVGKALTGFSIKGFVAALAEQGPTRGAQNVFVNRRIVKDKTIAHAIIEAYSNASIKERSPEVHLFLEIPADRIDVNVHPTKAEVRFRDQSFIHEAVKHAVADAIGKGAVPELQLLPEQLSRSDADGAVDSECAERRDLSEPMGRIRLGAMGALGATGALGALGAVRTWNRNRNSEPGTRNR